MPDALLTSLSALSTQQRAMEVTSHNIANAATPGYTRQRVDMLARTPEDLKPGQVGRGVDIAAIRRITDDMVTARLRQAEGESTRLASLKSNLAVVQQAFNEPGENGLAAVTGRMFSALEDLSSNPESAAMRASAVNSIQTWSHSVADLGDRLQQVRDDLQTGLEGDIARANVLTTSIVQLNRQIRSQVALGNNPNDLMDQRERQLTELGSLVDGRVITDPKTQSASVLVNGQMLVGPDMALTLAPDRDADGNLVVGTSGGPALAVAGGSLGALYDLHRNLVPGIIAGMDTLVSSLAQRLNAIQATGVSNSLRVETWTGDRVITPAGTTLNLDDPAQLPVGVATTGIPATFAPHFTDSTGAALARNLTINVLDTTTNISTKYTVRYDPATGNGGRTMSDLVSAINTGRGGGFTLYPPLAGIPGVSAGLVAADGGYRMQLRAAAVTTAIDFSPTLDTQPGATTWTGTGSVAVTGTAAPALGVERINAEVNAAGTAVQLVTRDPATGVSTVLGSVAIPGAGTATATINGLTLTVGAGSFRAGDRFGVGLTAGGAVINPATGLAGTHTQANTWSAGNPVLTVKGRYSNTLSDPAQPWSLRVVTPGVVGAKAGTASPNNPPVVQFTVWTGTPSTPVQKTIVATLDDTVRAGQPIQLVDGVYATIGAGTFATAGEQVGFTVDGDPDQAGLLPALGINQLLHSDGTASSLRVADALDQDPTLIASGRTRNEGDNSGVLSMLSLRKQPAFGASGTYRFEDAYLATVSDVGVRVDETTRLGENQDALKASLQSQRSTVSGVSIDDEVGALILQQQAYGAAAKMVSAARENIQTLLEILR